MESERRNYLQRIADLEQSLERVQHEHDQIISQKQNQLEDYRSQIESAQKQVAQYKRFIDEQTAEREQEREDYGREVQKLSEICTEKEKHESKLKDRVRTLEEQLNTNYEDKCRLQSSYEETKQRLSEATRSVNELQQVLSELERTNEKTVQAERQLNDKINRLESALTTQMRANEEMKKDHTDQSLLIAHSFIDEMLEKTERIRCASSTFDYRTSLMSITDLDVGSGDFNKSAIISGNNHDASSMESCRQASCGSTDPSTSCELIDGSTATNSFANTRLLEQKIRSFYDMIESLNRQNARLKGDLVEARDARSEYETRFEQLDVEKTRLERDLSEIRRTKQVLQEELNHKQKQLIGLKQRLDENASQETAQYRQAVDELRAELKREEDRCNDLNVRLAESVETLERKDAQLQSMTTRLDTLQREKSRIEGEHGVLQKTNHELTTQQRQLNDELQQLQSDLQKEKHDHQQTEQQEAVLPQLFAILLKDKEEEIEVLRRKLNQFQSRLRQLVPDSTTEDSMCLLNELQFRLRRYQDQEQTSKPTVCPVESGTSTTKPIMLNKSTGTSISRSALQSDKAINTDLDANAMSANDHDRMRQFVVSQLGDFIDQLEEQYTQLAAYQKDNELLRRRLSLGMDKNGGLLRSNSPDDSDLEIADDDVELADDDDDEDDPDSDTNDDDKIDDTLCLTLADVHNQSMELCKLTKRRCAQSAVVLRQLIAELPQLFVNDTDGSHPNREIDHNWQMKFVHNFPDREIGRLLVEKLVQIHDVHCSVRQRAQLSTSQLIFTQDKLAEAEKAIDRYKQMLESKRNDLSQYEMELKKLRKHGETLQSDRARCKQELAKNKEQINQLNRRLAENRSTNDPAADLNDTDAKDLYEQLRRVQAQRKALIFQKKYLMNVLSGLRQCAQPGDRTLNLITRLSCLLRPNELSRTIAANCEKMHVNRFKVVVYAVIAVRRLNRITSSKKPVTASANHRSTSIESSIPQMRHQQSDEAAYSCMYTPMSSTHVVGKSRSSVQLPSFSLNHQTERTYNMAGTKSLNKTKGQTRSNPITPSTDAGLACPATNSSLPSSTRPHPNQTKSVLLLNTFKKNATTSNNKQVDHVSKMNDCKSLDHSSQSPVSHHQHHSQPPQSTSSSLNRPDETTDDDPSLAQFYNELKRVHHVIGFDLSSTINSQNV